MKKTYTILAVGSAFLLGQAQAEIESEFHVGYNSKYNYRGSDLGDDAYEYGLDFAGSCECGLDWSAGIWSISPDNSDGNVDELDIYAAVSKDFNGATVAVGFTAYTYDSGADDAEVFLGVSGALSGFDLGATLYFGTDGILEQQVLLETSIGYGMALSDTASLNLGATWGYIVDNGIGGYATDEGNAYIILSASIDFALSDQITLSPYVSYVDGDSSNVAGTDDTFIGGASLSFSF